MYHADDPVELGPANCNAPAQRLWELYLIYSEVLSDRDAIGQSN